MKSAGRGSVVAGVAFAVVLFVLAGLSIVAHHHWRAVITAEDIPIITGWFSVAATTLAFMSAQASRAAANDSRRALLLHFRPESVHAAFNVRDPHDMYGQMPYAKAPSPGTLWLTLTPQGQNPAEEYIVTWVRDDGVAVSPRHVTLSPGQGEHISLDGVSAEEVVVADAPRQTVATLTRLTVECQDSQVKAQWKFTRSWPERGPMGSYRLVFDLDG